MPLINVIIIKNIVAAVGITRRIRLYFPIKVVKQVHSSGAGLKVGIYYVTWRFFCWIRETKLSLND